MIKCNKADCEIKGSEGIVGAEFGVILYNLLKNGVDKRETAEFCTNADHLQSLVIIREWYSERVGCLLFFIV